MLNLVDAIVKLNKEIGQERIEFNRKIDKMEAVVEYLKEINEACIACNGKGEVFGGSLCTANIFERNDPRNWITCPACGGTGLEKKEVK